MKSSFAKTFSDLSRGNKPCELRFERPSTCEVELDGSEIRPESIHVLHAEIERQDSPAITDILINPEHKAKYDQAVLDLDKHLKKLKKTLNQKSKIKTTELEDKLSEDWGNSDFVACIKEAANQKVSNDELSTFIYNEIFNDKSLSIIKSSEFKENAQEYIKRYQNLFEKAGALYKKGVFNPTKAENSFNALQKHGFFKCGHRVHLAEEESSIGEDEFNKKLEAINADINGDEKLKELRKKLSKNTEAQALGQLLEKLDPANTEQFLKKLSSSEGRKAFRRELWAYYIHQSPESDDYLRAYEKNKNDIAQIEEEAAQSIGAWEEAVKLFNQRFVNMPFTLRVTEPTQVVLGRTPAKLKFIFSDRDDETEQSREEINTLSHGEERALHILNFIFEAEARIRSQTETVFIIDDPADSFDYKNKHAIIQYLRDLTEHKFFAQIILTHNFDFFRAPEASHIVNYKRCKMAQKEGREISIQKAYGIKNIFILKWKPEFTKSDKILCASIPFIRNLIEYTKSEHDNHYLTLTNLLHWREETASITKEQYFTIYNETFGKTEKPHQPGTPVVKILFTEANLICNSGTHAGLCLEDKVLLSIAIRLKAEEFLIKTLRIKKNNANYWPSGNCQFGKLFGEFKKLVMDTPEIGTLNEVSITISSNIHLNSFMYEPIIDLSLDHLIDLYRRVCALPTPSM
ncbi:MAG: Uncharacterized protein E1N59_3398 [Puniceicoccaceae bacterium 5H]|nr:MAG: Uncharacterized protein E1N59_3398 [Puniceicoccaceae bacterium 5H]